ADVLRRDARARARERGEHPDVVRAALAALLEGGEEREVRAHRAVGGRGDDEAL
ncbi:MAG: hypothetical protein AVDCRST_MAG54-2139, partial [uncultured Actinomycetospora sp.]